METASSDSSPIFFLSVTYDFFWDDDHTDLWKFGSIEHCGTDDSTVKKAVFLMRNSNICTFIKNAGFPFVIFPQHWNSGWDRGGSTAARSTRFFFFLICRSLIASSGVYTLTERSVSGVKTFTPLWAEVKSTVWCLVVWVNVRETIADFLEWSESSGSRNFSGAVSFSFHSSPVENTSDRTTGPTMNHAGCRATSFPYLWSIMSRYFRVDQWTLSLSSYWKSYISNFWHLKSCFINIWYKRVYSSENFQSG